MFASLASSFRVIQPLRTPGDPDAPGWPRWLQSVVDGLGLGHPAVVVDARFAGRVRRLANVDPDRIGFVLEAGSPDQVLGQFRRFTENVDV